MSSTKSDPRWFEEARFDKVRPESGSPEESELLEAAFNYYWKHGYPYVEMDDEEVERQFRKLTFSPSCLLTKDGKTIITQSMTALGLANLYQQHLMIGTTCRSFKTPAEVMQDESLLRDALRKRIRYGSDLLPYGIRKTVHGLSGAHRVSNFRPTAALSIFKHFRPNWILDPCAGWGGRMLGALGADISYVGIDPHRAAIANNLRLYERLKDLHPHRKMQAEFIVGCAEDIIGHQRWESPPELICTSPPYVDVEKYDFGSPDQSHTRYPTEDQWYTDFLGRLIEGCHRDLADDGILILNVNPDMESRTAGLAQGAGFKLLDTWQYALSMHQFGKSDKGDWKYEPVIVCGKGDATLDSEDDVSFMFDFG